MHSLASIIAVARAGALDRAWTLFEQGGYDQLSADPAALAVKGRLLKDRGLRTNGDMRRTMFRRAAASYALADSLSPQPYLLINVAALSCLAGDQERAAVQAGLVLERLDSGQDIAETPFYLAATRAEALLLRGDLRGADRAMADAVAQDPTGWSDHASTVRQLRLISDAMGLNAGWLDPYRPPRSLHFAGHLGVSIDDGPALARSVAALIQQEKVGFGFGALAAGADIIIAEQLLAAGAVLHVVLPTRIDAFRVQSLIPYGGDWVKRFDKCLEQAETVTHVTRVSGGYEPLASALAAEQAMGAAVLNARQYESDAVQLLVIDEGEGRFGTGMGTARDGKIWAAHHRRQHLLRWPRSAPVAPSADRAGTEGRRDRRLMALLHVSVDGAAWLDDQGTTEFVDGARARVAGMLAPVREQAAFGMATTDGWIIGFDEVCKAFDCADALRRVENDTDHGRVQQLRLVGHYGLVHWIDDRVTGNAVLAGPTVTLVETMHHAAMTGTITVSDSFAQAYAVRCDDPGMRFEHVGDCAWPGGDDVPVYVLG